VFVFPVNAQKPDVVAVGTPTEEQVKATQTAVSNSATALANTDLTGFLNGDAQGSSMGAAAVVAALESIAFSALELIKSIAELKKAGAAEEQIAAAEEQQTAVLKGIADASAQAVTNIAAARLTKTAAVASVATLGAESTQADINAASVAVSEAKQAVSKGQEVARAAQSTQTAIVALLESEVRALGLDADKAVVDALSKELAAANDLLIQLAGELDAAERALEELDVAERTLKELDAPAVARVDEALLRVSLAPQEATDERQLNAEQEFKPEAKIQTQHAGVEVEEANAAPQATGKSGKGTKWNGNGSPLAAFNTISAQNAVSQTNTGTSIVARVAPVAGVVAIAGLLVASIMRKYPMKSDKKTPLLQVEGEDYHESTPILM
jgi:hypothetical protein